MITLWVYKLFPGSFFQNLYYNYLNSYTKKVIDEIIFLIIQLLPYLIIGILISTLIKQYTTAENLKRIIAGKNTIISVIIASLLGIISPLGSYIVIPLSAAMVAAGLPLAPVVAFMVSSPLINPGLFILTFGALGHEMAIMRGISAFILGISAGFITQYALSQKYMGVRPQPEIDTSKLIKKRTFIDEALQYTKYISKHFLVGILIAALTKALIPVTWITSFMGENHFVSVLAATIAGVPLYSCGGAAIPVMQQLADMGADKGAILAFFISGPATKIANVVLLTSAYKKGVTYVYFLVSIFGAIVLGLLYHFF